MKIDSWYVEGNSIYILQESNHIINGERIPENKFLITVSGKATLEEREAMAKKLYHALMEEEFVNGLFAKMVDD